MNDEQIPTTIYSAVERVLDEHSAWIARPNPEVTKAVALAAGIAWSLYTENDATIGRLRSINGDLFAALQRAVMIIKDHVPIDALGTSSQGDRDVGFRSWPVLEEYLYYMEAALARAQEPKHER